MAHSAPRLSLPGKLVLTSFFTFTCLCFIVIIFLIHFLYFISSYFLYSFYILYHIFNSLFIFHILYIFYSLQVFPSSHTAGHFSMLGLGDVVMPGLLLCFVMRYDAYKRAQVLVVIWLLLVVTMATMVLIMVVLRIEKELK